jgi:hypothetical protein
MNHANHMNSIAAQAPQASPIEDALIRLEAQAAQLHDIVVRMTTRLDPVLIPTGPATGTDQSNEPRALPAPLVSKIENLTGFLQSSYTILQEIDRRLAL